MTSAPLFIHIPTPGDHYSPATGSATMTVIHHLADAHAERGGETRLIVNRGTRHDYGVGECIEVNARPYPPTWKRAVDAAVSVVGLGRPMAAGVYRPHLSAVPADFHGPLFLANAPAALKLARRLRPKTMICLWAHNELFRTYGDAEVRRVVAAADRVIGCSRFIADALARRLPSDQAAKVRVVHNGVNTDQFQPPPAPPRNSMPVILFVGRIQPLKGPDLLIRAAVKLAAENVPFLLRIVGSGNFSSADPLTPFEQELRDLAGPISDRVRFQPFASRADIPAIYQSADINVVPSNWDEPFGLTVLEGMACGLPSVVSRRGGIPEAAADAALYFDPPDIDGLADALRTLLNDASLRAEWGRKARNRAMEMTWDHSYQQLLAAIA
jgi:glycosyltransferase involved in cell wall biosynthesis